MTSFLAVIQSCTPLTGAATLWTYPCPHVAARTNNAPHTPDNRFPKAVFMVLPFVKKSTYQFATSRQNFLCSAASIARSRASGVEGCLTEWAQKCFRCLRVGFLFFLCLGLSLAKAVSAAFCASWLPFQRSLIVIVPFLVCCRARAQRPPANPSFGLTGTSLHEWKWLVRRLRRRWRPFLLSVGSRIPPTNLALWPWAVRRHVHHGNRQESRFATRLTAVVGWMTHPTCRIPGWGWACTGWCIVVRLRQPRCVCQTLHRKGQPVLAVLALSFYHTCWTEASPFPGYYGIIFRNTIEQ